MTLTLENLSPQIYQKLKARALQHGRSVMEEAATCLANDLGVIDPGERVALRDRAIRNIDNISSRLADRGFRAMTQDELRTAIDEGRE